MRVELSPASRDEQDVVDNLMQLYLYELSDVSQQDIWPNGRYGYQPLALYWLNSGWHPFLIRVDGGLAGFALVSEGPEEGPFEAGRGASAFFVLPKYRRRGVGRTAATALFRLFPGRWWVSEPAANEVAVAFWRAVIAGYTGWAYREVVRESDGKRTFAQTFVA